MHRLYTIFKLLMIACFALSMAHTVWCGTVTDPLGNEVFVRAKGKMLYSIGASYSMLQGGAVVRRDKEFHNRTGKQNFFTFDISGRNVRHLLTVGTFHTRFSAFTLDKTLFDAGRWDIIVPRAQGRIVGVLSKLTNTSITPQGRRIENRDITSELDWFLAGVRAESNLGNWVLSVKGLPQLSIPLPKIGINYATEFLTNYQLSQATNPFRGVTVTSPLDVIYLRFRDGSPENPGGAKLYRIKVYLNGSAAYDFAGGREPPGVLVGLKSSFSDGLSRWVDRNGYFIYRFSIPNPQTLEDIRFELDIANDYVVELSTDRKSWRLMLTAPGNPRDESNRGVRTFHYGEMTDETTMGFDMQMTFLGASIEAERAWYIRTFQYPTVRGKRTQRKAGAWFIDVNRRFGPVFWRSEYTHMDTFYNAGDFVDDDDNEDMYPDAIEPDIPVSSPYDRDGDRIPDWQDDFLLFGADPPRFRTGLEREYMDLNNNGVPDREEDDDKPDYRMDYEEGSYGHHTFLIFSLPFIKGLSLTPGYYEKHLIPQKRSARGWYGILSYSPGRIPGFGRLNLRYTIRRAHDLIPDDTVNRKDDLSLQNYLSNILTFTARYDQVENLMVETKFKYQYDALFHTRQRAVDTILINRVRYDWKIRPDLVLSPMFRSDRSLGFRMPYDRANALDDTRNAYILTLSHRLMDQLQLSAGLEYLTYRNRLIPDSDFNRKVIFLELILRGRAFGSQMGMLATFSYIDHRFIRSLGGSQKKTDISITLYLL
ncbi:hypothetical protein J7M22_19275 [Candidatus Poribacteria bacterium]|nr:hypothetical protein [Candidatus Poribacteria bacterium]